MRILGQRWQFSIGNSVVYVDNAFSWWGWAQERLVVNDEAVKTSGAWFATKAGFHEAWLGLLGEEILSVRLKSTLIGVTCEVCLGNVRLEPDGLFETEWRGRRWSWPPGTAWRQTDSLIWDRWAKA